jgi:TAT (twin-arginine translocation) pathway-exported protein
MKITISRRSFLRGAAAVVAVVSLPATTKVIEAMFSKTTTVSLLDEYGNVLGSTSDIVEKVTDELISFDVKPFGVTQTGTITKVKLVYKGVIFIAGVNDNVISGSNAKLDFNLRME